MGCGSGKGGSGCAACASGGACAALSVVAPFPDFTDDPRRSDSLGVSLGAPGAIASALATTAWAADSPDSLVGIGVDRRGTPVDWLAALCAGLTGGNGASLACADRPESVADGFGFAICAVAGETVGAGSASGDCDAMVGMAAFGAAAAGVSAGAASGLPADASAAGCAAWVAVAPKPAGGGPSLSEARALRSVCRSSELTVLTAAGGGMSPTGVALASLEVATVESLRGCTVGSWVVAMKAGAFGNLGSPGLNQKIEPIAAAPARTSAETLNGHARERRPVAKSILYGPLE